MTLREELRLNRSVLGGLCLFVVVYALLTSLAVAPVTGPLATDALEQIVGGGFNYAEAAGWMAVGLVVVAVVAIAIAPPLAPAVLAGFASSATVGFGEAAVMAAAFGLSKLARSER